MSVRDDKILLPQKTALAVFFFAIFGAATVIVNNIYFDAIMFGKSGATSIVKVSEVSIDSATLKSDAETLITRQFVANPHQKIEFKDKSALEAFAKDLRELEYGNSKKPVRILHYGDSILTTDELSGRVRYIMQRKFGDGGHGFVLLAKPWRWYNHLGVKQGASLKNWRIRPFTSGPLDDGLYGLGGVAFLARRGKNAKAWFEAEPNDSILNQVGLYEISFLKQPNGGSFSLYVDDKLKKTVNTSSDKKAVAYAKLDVPLGSPRLRVEFNNDGKIRLFGVVMETGTKGIVYDSLAINGARATALGRFDKEHWKSVMSKRDPSLVILMMGANEGANKFLNISQYKTDLAKILGTIKTGLPNTSCLVVGALDQAKKKPEGGLESKRMPFRLKKAQREVALDSGCAFFDTYEAMGGENSMAKWCTSGLGGKDFIHPTKKGAQVIGNWLAESLIHAYQSYNKNGATNEI